MSRRSLYNVTVGCDLIIDARTWRVEGLSADGFDVTCVEDGTYTCLAADYIDGLIADATCSVVTPVMAQHRKQLLAFTGGYERVQQLPPIEQVVIRARLGLAMAMESLEQEGHTLTQRLLDKPEISRLLRRTAMELTGDKKLFLSVDGDGNPYEIAVPKGRTLQKYRKLLAQYDRNPIVLLSRDHMKGPRGDLARKICDVGERFIRAVVDRFLHTSQPKAAVVYRNVADNFSDSNGDFVAGVKLPSLTTIRTRIREMSSNAIAVARLGTREAANRFKSGTTAERAKSFGEYVETDQCLLSIFVDDTGTRRSEFWKEEDQQKFPNKGIGEPRNGERLVCRYWLSLVIDVATRMPLGWQLSETATAEATMYALRMSMRSKDREKLLYGCKNDPAPAVGFTELRSDNGTAVRNRAVLGALAGLRSTTRIVRAYAGGDKPYVERLFGTVDIQLLNCLLGYAGSKPNALPGANPMKDAALTRDDLYELLTKFFIDIYPSRPHRGTGMNGATPLQKMEQAIEKYGVVPPPSAAQRRLHLGETRTVSVTAEGVQFLSIPFNSRALQAWSHTAASKKVTVYLDPDNLKQVTVAPIGTSEVLTADLSMTNLRDTTLPNALRLLREASLLEPEVGTVTDDCVKTVIARETRQLSLSERARVDRNTDRIMDYERHAAELENVDVRPSGHNFDFARTGSIMDVMTRGATGGNAGPEPSATDPVPPSMPDFSTAEAERPNDGNNSPPQPAHPRDNPEPPTEPEFGRLKESKF